MAGFFESCAHFFTIINIPIFLFMIISIIIGLYFNNRHDHKAFLTGSPGQGIIQSSISIAVSDIGAVALLVYTAFVYRFGICCLWIYIGILTGRILFTFFALHLRKVAGTKSFLTITDYFAFKYGRVAALFVVSVLFLWYFGQLSIQFVGGGKVISELTGTRFEISVGIICAICIVYLISGGFKSLLKTDIFQFFILLFIIILIIFSIKSGLDVPIRYFDLFNAGIIQIASFFVLGIFQQFAYQDNWHRAFTIKDEDTVKQSFTISGLIEFGFAVLLTYLGLVIRTRFPGMDPEAAVTKGFTQLVPSYMAGFTAVAFFASIISTADSYIFILALNISKDFWNIPVSQTKKLVRATRIGILAIGFAAISFAFIYKDITNLTIVLKAAGLVIAPIVIFCWIGRGCKKAIITTVCIITSLIGFLALAGYIKTNLFLFSILGGFLVYGIILGFTVLYNYFKPEEQLENLEEVE